MGCPETHKLVRCELCEIYFYPGINRPCKNDAECNSHFQKWLESDPEIQALHKEYLNGGRNDGK